MNPVEQRIAIAQTQGFNKVSEIFYDKKKNVKWASPVRYFLKSDELYYPEQQFGWEVTLPEWNKDSEPSWNRGDLVPNYLNNLDDMHEVEKTIHHFGAYHDILASVMKIPRNGVMLIHATAAQKAEAYLRTLDLWKEDK